MAQESGLGCLVVVGRNAQLPLCAELFCLLRMFDRFACVVGAGANDDRNPISCCVHSDGDDLLTLCHAECAGFACGAEDDQSVDSAVNLARNELPEADVIDAVVGKKRCNQRRGAAGKEERVPILHDTFLLRMMQIEKRIQKCRTMDHLM